jgi:hypothetical protein
MNPEKSAKTGLKNYSRLKNYRNFDLFAEILSG